MATCESKQLCNIIATVPTGLEKGAADECRDVLGRVDVEPQRGKIVIPLCALQELDKVCRFILSLPFSELLYINNVMM